MVIKNPNRVIGVLTRPFGVPDIAALETEIRTRLDRIDNLLAEILLRVGGGDVPPDDRG